MAKRLYTEMNVRELPAGSELVLGKDAIATPSALELAFARAVRTGMAADADLAKLAAENVDIVWHPGVEAMYPEGFATRIVPDGPALAHAAQCGQAPAGFDAKRAPRNIGHNQRRMTFVCRANSA